MNNPYNAIRAFTSSSAGRGLVRTAAKDAWAVTKIHALQRPALYGAAGGAVAGVAAGSVGDNGGFGRAVGWGIAGAAAGYGGGLGFSARNNFRGVGKKFMSGARGVMRPGF